MSATRVAELEAQVAALEAELAFYRQDRGQRILALTAQRIEEKLASGEDVTSSWITAARQFLADNDLKLRSLESPSNAAVHQFPFKVVTDEADDHYQPREAEGT